MTLDITWQTFVEIFGLLFGLFLLLSGIFTAYFGSGKSRKIGVGLVVGGILVGILMVLFYISPAINPGYQHGQFTDLLVSTLFVLIASILGALAAIGLFLVAIMKS